MSLFYGICHANCQDINENSYRHYPKALVSPNLEQSESVKERNCYFGLLLTLNKSKAKYGQMLKYVEARNIMFVCEGRIDNRLELSATLGLESTKGLSDSEIMLQAYLKWGKTAPSRLLGDWSFAAYDYTNKELFLARDQMGNTSLYYHFSNQTFFFSSSIKYLLQIDGLEKKPNMGKVLENYLLIIYPSNESNYKNIFEVPHGHCLTFDGTHITLSKYWHPENVEPIYKKRTEDYCEELLEILKLSIKQRLKNGHNIASKLSGGLDSSTVSFLAAELLSNENKQLTTFSHVPLFKNEISQIKNSPYNLDETQNILSIVEASQNIKPHLLTSENMPPSLGITKYVDICETTLHAPQCVNWILDILQTSQEKEMDTLLEGGYGNASISFTGIDYLLPFFHPSLVLNPKKSLKTIVKPFLQKLNLLRFSKQNLHYYIHNRLHVKPEMIAQYGLMDIISAQIESANEKLTDAKALMLKITKNVHHTRNQAASLKHHFGIDITDPTGDVRVLEYCLSIPNEFFFDKYGDNKQVLKKMMKNRLPETVLFSKKRGLQSSDIVYKLIAEKAVIHDMIVNLSKNALFSELIDIPRLLSDWNLIIHTENISDYRYKANAIAATLMLGKLLERFP